MINLIILSFRILKHKLNEYNKVIIHKKNTVRGRKVHTARNLQKRRDAELELTREKNPITWLQFLKKVSHTNDSLLTELTDQFRGNGDRVDDPRIVLDPTDDIRQTCVRCQLNIDQRFVLDCGDVNVCGPCIQHLKNNQPSICPNEGCDVPILPSTNACPIVIRN